MSAIANMKIGAKLLALVILVTGLGSVLAISKIWQMQSVGSRYSGMINEDVAAKFKLDEFEMNVHSLGRLQYRMIVEASLDGRQRTAREIAETMTETTGILDQVARVNARIATDVAALREPLRQFDQARERVAAAALANESAQAERLAVEVFSPASRALRAAANRLTTDLDRRIKEQNTDITAYVASNVAWGYGFTAMIAALSLGLGFIMSRVFISGPIVTLNGAMGGLAAGKLDTEVPFATRKDEIGQMAGTVQVFKENAQERERLEQQARDEQAARQRRADTVDRLVKDFEAAATSGLQTVAAAASQLDTAARTMQGVAGDAQHKATISAASADETAANVNSVASATQELAASLSEVGRQVQRSAEVTNQAVSEAQRTSGVVAELSSAAQKIGDVVNLIANIAAQTNLLALNATIEAARAGDAGKGFAVVAQEVKALASQTAKATDDISSQIAAIQTSTGSATTAIEGIGRTISEINEIASAIAAAIEEQNGATSEIARNVAEAARGTTDVSANIGGVSQAAVTAGASASQVLSAAQSLTRQSDGLKARVESFLGAIRAA
jgi:methyl-accepting chemotaxis protein